MKQKELPPSSNADKPGSDQRFLEFLHVGRAHNSWAEYLDTTYHTPRQQPVQVADEHFNFGQLWHRD